MNKELIYKMLIVDEGYELKPYHCSEGKVTIGVGRNLTDRGISKCTALQMLDEDVSIARLDCVEMFGVTWCEDAGVVRVSAVINMLFNLGKARFMTFKKMIEHLKNYDFENAAREALDSKWARQVGRRSRRIALAIRDNEVDDDYNRLIEL